MLSIKNYAIQLVLLFVSLSSSSIHAQIYGKGKMTTKSYPLADIYKVEVDLYADITIDMKAEAGITITAEENIHEFIGVNINAGILGFDQKKWIEPNQRIVIKIGTSDLREVAMGTHDDLKVVNVSGEIFKVEADIGKVILSGKVDDLRVKAQNGTVDASQLISRIASVRIKGDGRVQLNASESVDCDIDEDGRFENLNKSAKDKGCQKARDKEDQDYSKTKYIDLNIKNNSWSRKQFVVVGPKPNGRKFSYGFPMMPGATKKERWTVGTKVYRENRLGMRTLLVTLTESDENTTVELFE